MKLSSKKNPNPQQIGVLKFLLNDPHILNHRRISVKHIQAGLLTYGLSYLPCLPAHECSGPIWFSSPFTVACPRWILTIFPFIL
jgi:hypothetical protein